jgi:thioesterase domain-containing protein/acyl carrier protein
MYGPTEACIDATAHMVSEADFDLPVLPIGRPLANDRAYVLDARLRPVPPGVAGTLFLAGAGLARGYVGQPGLTAARFVANPFEDGRMYDTGDRALWRADGTLVFLGRTDAQVKIRGFRVEPGEIEAALRSHPEISQAAVIARDGRLIAYVVPAVPADLRAWLGGRLPSHMVPAAFVALAALPLTPNGKLDHRALPAPDADEAAAERVAPRDEIETALLAAWKSVLGLAEIGVQDDFFLIGGDSLAAIRLVGACNAALGVTLPVAGLFAHRTIEAMAAAIRSGRGSRLVTLQQGRDGEPPLVCVHPVGGTTLCYGPLVGALPVDLPVLGLDASGLNENESLASSVEAMAADYVAALRRQHPAGPYRLAGYSIGGVVAFEMARQLMAAGETVHFVALLDTLDPGREDVARLSTEAAMVAVLAEEIGLPPQTTPPATTLELYTAAQDAGMVPPNFTLAQAERIVGVHLNNARIAERYRPAVALPVPILLVRATARDGAPPDWTRFAGATIDTVDFDCTHAELVSDDMAQPLAAAIGRYL